MKKFVLAVVMFVIMAISGCSSENIPTGHKGFMFDKTGPLAMYTGGAGVDESRIIGSGTEYTGIYDTVVGVNCQSDANREQLPVLTKSDMKVVVDVRITYASDCATKQSLLKIINDVPAMPGTAYVQPDQVFQAFVMPSIKESLRNKLSQYTIDQVKNVRSNLSSEIQEEVEKSIKENGFPVKIKLLTVSDITLPEAITTKIKEIEVARMEASKETEKQRASTVRLERELFEASEEMKIQKQRSLKEKDVLEVKAQADLAVKRLEIQGIKEMREQLTPRYIEYLKIERDAEVQKRVADAMSKGTVYYLGSSDFAIAPGSRATVAVGAN